MEKQAVMQCLSWPTMVVYGSPRPGNRRWTRFIGVLLLICFAFLGEGISGAQEVDWSSWEEMPVFHNGRVMPLISFAEETVELICGRANPVLAPAEPGKSDHLFPGGPRRFRASELLLSWIVEPERWQEVPFLFAGHEELRAAVGRAVAGRAGAAGCGMCLPNRSASPRDFANCCARLPEKLKQANAEGRRPRLTPLEESGQRLYRSLSVFQALTYRANRCRTASGRILGSACAGKMILIGTPVRPREQLSRTVNRVAPDFPAGQRGNTNKLSCKLHFMI